MVDNLVENILAVLAERKIAEAMEDGVFDNLPGKGKPLPEDDLANLPDDVRLAYRILRMSGASEPPEGVITEDSPSPALSGAPETAGGPATPRKADSPPKPRPFLEELELGSPSESKIFRNLENLRVRLGDKNPLNKDQEQSLMESGYLEKILEKLFPEKPKP
ncbi:MAG: DUF1992 domain-containing protein [Deltaproteobacteria bacterium]|nr:DUF1992 domain-containing protein [Deltaproteobacteria bacterium]